MRKVTGASSVASRPSKAKIYRMMNSPNTIYRFKRTTSYTLGMNPSFGFINASGSFGISSSFYLNAVAVSTGSLTYNANVSNATEFTALFDQWRIAKVVVKYVYSNNTSTTASAVTNMPLLYVCNDNDNANVVANREEIQERPDHKLWQLGTNGGGDNIRTMTCYPCAAVGTYGSGFFNSFGQGSRNMWLDCASTSIQLYGQKAFWPNFRTASTTDIGDLMVIYDIYYEFKGVQ